MPPYYFYVFQMDDADGNYLGVFEHIDDAMDLLYKHRPRDFTISIANYNSVKFLQGASDREIEDARDRMEQVLKQHWEVARKSCFSPYALFDVYSMQVIADCKTIKQAAELAKCAGLNPEEAYIGTLNIHGTLLLRRFMNEEEEVQSS